MISGPDTHGNSLYEILEVPPAADAAEIRDAYRRLASIHHPDRGGDAEVFKVVKFAYEVLSDPDRRRDYDKNGITGLRDRTAEAHAKISEIVIGLLDSCEPGQVDLIKLAGDVIAVKIQDIRAKIVGLEKKAERCRRARSRLVYAGNDADFIADGLTRNIDKLEREIGAMNDAIELGEIMAAMLKSHTYKVDSLYPPFSRTPLDEYPGGPHKLAWITYS